MMKSIVKAPTSAVETALEKANRALARKAAAQGFVLLENNGVLPLKDRRIALYGTGARMTVKGGTGSGAVRERYSVSVEQGLRDAGYEIATEGWLDRFDRFYSDTYEAYRREQEEKVKGMTNFYQMLGAVTPFQHPTGIPIEEADVADCDTALYVLARQAGEGNDRKNAPGDYQLDEVEKQNISLLSRYYKNLVVVVNVGGLVNLSFMEECSVAALVYFVQGGEEGGNALADVLSGKADFSGRLTTSVPCRFEDVPSSHTYSDLGDDPYRQAYNEGIYLGYRYYDTFGVAPRYPFGYGLSYTSFAMTCEGVKAGDEAVRVEARVVNTGERTGRQVVQLYATVPFGRDGAERQRLAAFAKTPELQPGEAAHLTLTVPVKQLACYDERASRWVLRAGDYVFRLGEHSRRTDAIAVLKLAEEILLEQCEAICPPQEKINELTAPTRPDEALSGVHTIDWKPAIVPVMHTYETPECADPLADRLTPEELAALVCGGGTSNDHLQVTALGASGTTTPDLWEARGIPNVILSDGPAGLNLSSHISVTEKGVQATLCPETLEAYKRYLFGPIGMAMKSRMAKPGEGTEHYQYATAWPCSQLLAQSFDEELLCEVGDAVGQEMEAFGVTVWLAPGMNLHRNPLCGRTFEYYSEDPLVSGKLAAAIVRGVQSHPGKGMSVKHFAANSCELNRNESSSDLSERALRELYLRGFEIAVKESCPMTVMAAYNKINGVYCTNNYDLLVKTLRNEWAYEGLVMSDWDSMKAEHGDCMKAATGDVLKAAAAQCDLVCPGRPDQVEALKKGLAQGLVKEADLRRSAARIIRMIRQNDVLPIQEES